MSWADGRYAGARRVDAHPGRVGEPIVPWACVVHTTDEPPETWGGIMTRMRTEAGKGDGAHFWIGRDAAAGVIQSVPITRNANHAGGDWHGVFVDAAGNEYRPNHVAVGIELHCAGRVQRLGGMWRFIDGGKPSGAPISDLDVIPDRARAGYGWHKVTDYQLEQLELLLRELEYDGLADAPAGAVARSTFETPPAWGLGIGRICGHISLDAKDRSDPWPQVMEFLRSRT